ncbi:MAG: ABC transporter ATP-binding protein/permease [candidate division Zixibacteria bacterium]|nr:ABC transporter ATP-binding protein/permease [candidate division Zixibacteria bacterium]
MAGNTYHEEEALGKAYDARLMKRLMAYVRPYRWVVVVAVVLLLLVSALQVVMPYLVQVAIDDHITPGDIPGLRMLTLLALGVLLVSFLVRYLQTYIMAWLGQKVLHDIRRQVFGHLQTLNLQFFDRNPVGRLLTRVTNDVNTLNELFSSGVVTIIGDVFTLVLIVAALLYYNWQLALITFTVIPLLVTATFVFRARVRNVYREVRVRLARLNAFLQEHLTGMKVVQLFGREERTFEKFDEINRDLRGVHLRGIYYYAVFFPTVEVIGALSIGLLLYFGGFRVQSGVLTFGELVAFMTLVEMFYRPIRDLAEKYNILQASMASSERIFQLLDSERTIPRPESPRRIDQFAGRIEFKNLWFAYHDEDWVLKDISFTVEPGEKIAIVGATGAGKSSLISLLYRFYDYQKGSITIDGVDLKELEIPDLRRHLGLVLQDVFLFSGDLAGNVRLREDSISEQRIRQALQRVGFDRFLDQMPNGLATEIKERGATLSTGQKQLLSFARALAFDPDILILDEATSSVDTETERLIQKALEELLKDRTSIIIAHRLSTIEQADKIIVLHHGKVREWGQHDELLKQRGIYYRLYQMQYRKQSLSGGGNVTHEQKQASS